MMISETCSCPKAPISRYLNYYTLCNEYSALYNFKLSLKLTDRVYLCTICNYIPHAQGFKLA